MLDNQKYIVQDDINDEEMTFILIPDSNKNLYQDRELMMRYVDSSSAQNLGRQKRQKSSTTSKTESNSSSNGLTGSQKVHRNHPKNGHTSESLVNAVASSHQVMPSNDDTNLEQQLYNREDNQMNIEKEKRLSRIVMIVGGTLFGICILLVGLSLAFADKFEHIAISSSTTTTLRPLNTNVYGLTREE